MSHAWTRTSGRTWRAKAIFWHRPESLSDALIYSVVSSSTTPGCGDKGRQSRRRKSLLQE
jgi:hypothetical protein